MKKLLFLLFLTGCTAEDYDDQKGAVEASSSVRVERVGNMFTRRLYRVTDQQTGVVCYAMQSGISCIAPPNK